MNQSNTTPRTWSLSQCTSVAATALLVSLTVPNPVVSGQRLLAARLNENSASSHVGAGHSWGNIENGSDKLTTLRTRSCQSLRQLDDHSKRVAAARALLRRWLEEGDEAEQQATLSYLIETLDADRTSDRKLFP